MENGESSNIGRKFAVLDVNIDAVSSSNDAELYQIKKAIEAAEAIIKEQLEDNIRLTSLLQIKDDQLRKYNNLNNELHTPSDYCNVVLGFANQVHVSGGNGDVINTSEIDDMSFNSVAIHQTDIQENLFDSRQVGVKQELVVKVREHEEEIMQLKKHLAEYSVKDVQISNEKSLLEKRISYMRTAFDQQQHDLVDAASKAIFYRQDIMEDNVRLTYALQAAQQERSTFVSALMPLLAEYSLQPPAADAHSIVSNLKVLFKHLQEQLLVTGDKLKDSQYQLGPWRSDVVNLLNFVVDPNEIKKNGLELVHQPTYSNQKTDHHATGGDLLIRHPQNELADVKNFGNDDMSSYPPLTSRNMTSVEEYSQLRSSNQAELHPVRSNEEIINKKVTFGDFVRNEIDEPDTSGASTQRPINLNDPSSYSPYLPPVLEEPSSSYSEAADDDPPPGIKDLQISGDAFPASQLQACGHSINGTTSCNFEWVRHLEDGSFSYIDGAKQPNYLITADDIDTYLAIEVQPLDDRKRKGELVKVFANEHQKITCDPEMQDCIEKTLYRGRASYRLSLSTSGFLDIWEPATLAIKRDGYTIKCSGPSGVVVTDKFSSSTIVYIPYGSPTEFSVVDSQGNERILKVDNSTTDINNYRDTIVLSLRLFIIKAGEKRKGKKRGLFFNK